MTDDEFYGKNATLKKMLADNKINNRDYWRLKMDLIKIRKGLNQLELISEVFEVEK